MKNRAFTDFEKISQISVVLSDIEDISPAAYVFFLLIFEYGLKQDDILSCRVDRLFSDILADKYPDICLSRSGLVDYIPKTYRAYVFKDLLHTRDYLFKILNKCAKQRDFGDSLNVRVLQKTWAFVELTKERPLPYVMSHFSYRHSAYRFLSEFLGLSFEVCSQYPYLCNLYASACFAEIASLDYTAFTDEQRKEFLSLLNRILRIIGLLE